jgi:hypothetical protein
MHYTSLILNRLNLSKIAYKLAALGRFNLLSILTKTGQYFNIFEIALR